MVGLEFDQRPLFPEHEDFEGSQIPFSIHDLCPLQLFLLKIRYTVPTATASHNTQQLELMCLQ